MTQLFRQEVIDKRKQRLTGVISLVQPPLFKWLALLLLALVVISLVYLSLGTYSRKETVTGVLQPDSGLLRVSAPQAGIVAELLVTEGQMVEKDQPLLLIKSEKHGIAGFELNQSLINQYRQQHNTLQQQRTKLHHKHQFEIQALNNKQQTQRQRLTQLANQSDLFNQRIALNQQILDQASGLAGTGYISELELKRQQDSLLSLMQQSALLDGERLTVNDQLAQLENQLKQLPLEQGEAMRLLDTQLAQLQSQLHTIEQQRLSELRAPAAGMISGLLVTAGKSVLDRQNLLSIVPLGSVMQAVVYVPTSAFGFISKGQVTRLRYHAFPYQRFGLFEGQIAQISANVILPGETDIPGLIDTPSYRVVVALNNQVVEAYGRMMPLRSGMKLDADIVIERRSLIRWLFDPLFSIKGQL